MYDQNKSDINSLQINEKKKPLTKYPNTIFHANNKASKSCMYSICF